MFQLLSVILHYNPFACFDNLMFTCCSDIEASTQQRFVAFALPSRGGE